jgi:hypothetical protein
MKRVLVLLLAALITMANASFAQSTRTATGTITANGGSVTMNTADMNTCRFIISGTWSGTIGVKVQAPDMQTWLTVSVYPYAPGGASVSSITANGQWKMACSSQQAVQVVATAWTSGTATVSIAASTSTDIVDVTQGTASNLNFSPNTVYNSSPPTPSAGASTPLQGDASGNLKDTLATLLWYEDSTNYIARSTPSVVAGSTSGPTYSYLFDYSNEANVTHNSFSGACQLMQVDVANVGYTSGATYLLIYNSTGSTSGTIVWSEPIGEMTSGNPVTATTKLFGPNGMYLSTGLTWALSTTATSYTAATAANYIVNVGYVTTTM